MEEKNKQNNLVKRLLTPEEGDKASGGMTLDGGGSAGDYSQTSGNYTQTGGGHHSQTGGGDYTQSACQTIIER